MYFSSHALTWQSVPAMIAGPVMMGLCIGLPYGVSSGLNGAATLPALVIGVAAFMLPALYIGTAFLGEAPPAGMVLRSALMAFRDLGTVLAGVTPAVAFLLATSDGPIIPRVLSLLPMTLGALIGLRALAVRLLDGRPAKPSFYALYTAWSFVALGIGFHFFARMLEYLPGVSQ